MDNIDINLDEDFKNINTDLSSNNDTIGIDLLVGGGGAGGSAENPSYGGGNGGDGIVLVAYPQ